MKVRWKGITGMVNGQAVGRDKVTEVPDEDGARYCRLGYCTPVAEAAPEPETATAPEQSEKREEPKAEEPEQKEEPKAPAKKAASARKTS